VNPRVAEINSGIDMWTPTTRKQHIRKATRYQSVPANLQRRSSEPSYLISAVPATAHSRSASARAVEGAIRTRTI
jgi:hypothetical protein